MKGVLKVPVKALANAELRELDADQKPKRPRCAPLSLLAVLPRTLMVMAVCALAMAKLAVASQCSVRDARARASARTRAGAGATAAHVDEGRRRVVIDCI